MQALLHFLLENKFGRCLQFERALPSSLPQLFEMLSIDYLLAKDHINLNKYFIFTQLNTSAMLGYTTES